MLEMQRLAPQMRKLQNEHRNDKAKLNEEMMKLYQEHKVNPMASCLPMVAQMPVFLIMFRVLHGLTYKPNGAALPVAADGVAGVRQRGPGGRSRASSLATWRSTRRLYQALFGAAHDDVARPRPVEVGRRRDRREFRHRAPLRAAGRAARRPVLRPAADGRRSCGDQPDHVAGATEADAVPAGVLRRLPGLLPRRPRRLLHLPDRAAHRPADVHHQGVLRARRGARPPGAACRCGRPRRGRRSPASRRACSARPSAISADPKDADSKGGKGSTGKDSTARTAGKKTDAGKAAAERGRNGPPVVSKRVTPPKNRPTPSSSAKGRPTPSRARRPQSKSQPTEIERHVSRSIITDGAAMAPSCSTITKEHAMEWVETTAKTLDEAREAALDQLGVGARRRRVRHPRRARARAVRPHAWARPGSEPGSVRHRPARSRSVARQSKSDKRRRRRDKTEQGRQRRVRTRRSGRSTAATVIVRGQRPPPTSVAPAAQRATIQQAARAGRRDERRQRPDGDTRTRWVPPPLPSWTA